MRRQVTLQAIPHKVPRLEQLHIALKVFLDASMLELDADVQARALKKLAAKCRELKRKNAQSKCDIIRHIKSLIQLPNTPSSSSSSAASSSADLAFPTSDSEDLEETEKEPNTLVDLAFPEDSDEDASSDASSLALLEAHVAVAVMFCFSSFALVAGAASGKHWGHCIFLKPEDYF
jgi:hypothetical protein